MQADAEKESILGAFCLSRAPLGVRPGLLESRVEDV